jgi:hypothetical protein
MNPSRTPLYAFALCLLLAGCGDPKNPQLSTADETVSLRNVEGLRDCVYIRVDMPLRYLHVVRCPASTTTTSVRSGKSIYTATVVSP